MLFPYSYAIAFHHCKYMYLIVALRSSLGLMLKKTGEPRDNQGYLTVCRFITQKFHESSKFNIIISIIIAIAHNKYGLNQILNILVNMLCNYCTLHWGGGGGADNRVVPCYVLKNHS